MNEDWLYDKYIIEGLSQYNISDISGYSQGTISYYLKNFKIKKDPPPYKNKKWLEQKYITEELSIMDIAKICNSSHTPIFYWLKNIIYQ